MVRPKLTALAAKRAASQGLSAPKNRCRCQLQHKMNKRSLMWRTPFHNCFGGVLVNFDQKSWHGCLLQKDRALRPIVVGRGQSSAARRNQMAHFESATTTTTRGGPNHNV